MTVLCRSFPPRRRAAFTLVELLITITLVAILSVAAWSAYAAQRRKAEDIACVKTLRETFYPALNAYMIGNAQTWPQEPKDTEDNPIEDEKLIWNWWFDTMEKYGVARKSWFCPAEFRLLKANKHMTAEERKQSMDDLSPSYIPMSFSDAPNEAMDMIGPWVIEREDFHEKGHNILRSDGVIIKEMRMSQMATGGR